MGIIVHDELKTQSGLSVKDYYGSFSEGIRVNKIRELTSEETSESEYNEKNGWIEQVEVFDSSKNLVFDVDASGNRTKRTVKKYYKLVETSKYNINATFRYYISKEARNNSNLPTVFKDRKSRDNYNHNSQRYASISSIHVEGIFDDSNKVYEKLYTKLKSMDSITNFTDDL